VDTQGDYLSAAVYVVEVEERFDRRIVVEAEVDGDP